MADTKNGIIKVNILGIGIKEAPCGTALIDIARQVKAHYKFDILAAKINNEVLELYKKVYDSCEIEFLDARTPNGFRVYQRSVSFLMIYAAKEILGKKAQIAIEHSINKNYYCEILDCGEITDGLLAQIEEKMRLAVQKEIVIEKHSFPLEDSLKLAEQFGLYDKIQIMSYRRTANVNLYKLDWFYNYFYGQMAYDTGCLPYFQLKKEDKGFMLCFPSFKSGEPVISHISDNYKKISSVFNESNKWAKILKAGTVGSLNDIISGGKTGRFILTNEALHEKRIGLIADQIHQKNCNIVLIAGPSSSGKTTFAERLGIQLRVNGLRPNVISLDNYYRNRGEIRPEPDGSLNLEAITALDIKLINDNLSALISGQAVEIPSFNFLTGLREYKGRVISLPKGGVLIIEGIHGLNDRLTSEIPSANKFKIFISALTQLNIDAHNRIPTTDTRLIRRIVRDNQFRGADASRTISMWQSVLQGEEEYIFPYQEKADAFFNSALVYEMCILKQYAEPLLFKIKKTSHQYTEARRLIKFLDCFLGVPSEEVPKNSILREFIGGGCFKT